MYIYANSILFLRMVGMDGFRHESNCPLVGPGTMGGELSVGVFLRDISPYLREFRRKPRKIPNDKRDRGLNLAPPVFQDERYR